MRGAEQATRLAVAALATWRVTHLLASEDGPADAVVRLRARLGGGPAGRLVDCFQCLSLWTAAPAAAYAGRGRRDALPVWLALSGAACLLERLGAEPLLLEPIPQGGGRDGLLRAEAGGV